MASGFLMARPCMQNGRMKAPKQVAMPPRTFQAWLDLVNKIPRTPRSSEENWMCWYLAGLSPERAVSNERASLGLPQ